MRSPNLRWRTDNGIREMRVVRHSRGAIGRQVQELFRRPPGRGGDRLAPRRSEWMDLPYFAWSCQLESDQLSASHSRSVHRMEIATSTPSPAARSQRRAISR